MLYCAIHVPPVISEAVRRRRAISAAALRGSYRFEGTDLLTADRPATQVLVSSKPRRRHPIVLAGEWQALVAPAPALASAGALRLPASPKRVGKRRRRHVSVSPPPHAR